MKIKQRLLRASTPDIAKVPSGGLRKHAEKPSSKNFIACGNFFYVKTYGTKTVVTRNHRRMRHPAVVKIAASAGKFFYEFFHTLPGRVAHAFRLFSARRVKSIPYPYPIPVEQQRVTLYP